MTGYEEVQRGSCPSVIIIVDRTRADNKIQVCSSGFSMARAQLAKVYT